MTFRLFPAEASSLAPQVDAVFLFELAIAAVFTFGIAATIGLFVIKYRRRPGRPREVPHLTNGRLWLMEGSWTLIPLGLCVGMFLWGTKVYVWGATVPAAAEEVLVVGKQWMWKFQHAGGQREINDLHLPLGRDVRLVMTSEDVIHSWFVPEFRVKMDVLPKRFTTTWVRPTRAGIYYLFCSQYCGTQHSRMTGKVYVLPPQDYQRWLAQQKAGPNTQAAGKALFVKGGCVACHQAQESHRGPILSQVYGSSVLLSDGSTVIADDEYLRESIVDPGRKVVAGYTPIMPNYSATFTDDELLSLVAYLKSLGAAASEPQGDGRANAEP